MPKLFRISAGVFKPVNNLSLGLDMIDSGSAAMQFSSPLSILLVDDDQDFVDSLSDFLKAAGHQVACSTSVTEALTMANEKSFDVVLCDIRMGEAQYAGLDLLEKIRNLPLACVLMSGYADYEVTKRGINSGATYYLEKPFRFAEAQKIIEGIPKKFKSVRDEVQAFAINRRLTPKETEVFKFILKGLSNKEIAEKLGNTEKTTKVHVTAIFKKCGVTSRTALFSKVFPGIDQIEESA